MPLAINKRGKQTDYEAKTVMLVGRRYIVCRNHQEAEKDAADRASIVAALERQLAKGDKALVGNTGYRRYLKTISDQHFAIDPDNAEDNKFDGIFVLRTNTDLNPLAAMLCYKQLWTVEQTFRTAKHLLSTRPIFHKLDETIRGHVFCSFLALVDFGGPWGLAWAAANPQAVASITCINTGVLSGYRWHYLARIWQTPLLGELFMASTTKAVMRLLLRHGNPRGLPAEYFDHVYKTFDRGTQRAVLRLYRNTLNTEEGARQLTEALRPLDLPALVVWGAHDPYISVEFAERQRQVFPRAEMKILPDSGHWPFADDPDAVAQAVLPFLRRQLQHN